MGKTFKLAISSRPYFPTYTISRRLQRQVELFSIDGAKEHENSTQDVKTFISQELRELRIVLALSEEEVQMVDFKLKACQQHNFLCAYFLTQRLSKNPPSTVQAMLDTLDYLPLGLEDHYKRTLTYCTDYKKAKATFSVLFAARRPLSVDDIAIILMLQPGFQGLTTSDRTRDIIRDTCGMLVHVVGGKVYLIHNTLKMFLLNPKPTVNESKRRRKANPWKHMINVDEGEARLPLACTRILGVKAALWGEQSGFREYARHYWGVHLSQTLRSAHCRRPISYIETMIGYGLNLQMLDNDDKSLLHRAVDIYVSDVNREIVRGILNQGKLVQTAADRDNMTCLHYATLRSDRGLVEMLLEAGFDINVAVRRRNPGAVHESHDRKGMGHGGLTALHAAAYFGRPDMVELLLNAGADAQAQDINGNMALHLVLSRSLGYKSREDLWPDHMYMLEEIPEYM
ncbi:uncharacterized protein A1O9_00052 [Exophiala aquamarina CBS 119918]|uniref:GPI inositol-deacylase winged helix domain-containing protein n=1 Tax=Exophiala aquamarina CBS 119918 TaxID=1182545 RepID=A0A072Q2F1_9EURO|nr:uncharacterized protein A1O9_00052 [Exophiala aquamarina CBS 119918]KEF62080.1 hypothetical protein A1O9_00052 [Exophiala aquamarina CBS 119918]